MKESMSKVATVAEVKAAGCKTVQVRGRVVALFAYGGQIFAVDNRCPHMGFPLDKGSVRDGILTCHWHHARFDLETGGTFDQWADDAPSFPVEVRDGQVWVDVTPQRDRQAHYRERLEVGLERDLSLVIAKSVLVLAEEEPVEAFRAGLAFGARYRRAGWGQGLTILTCMMNLIPYLEPADRPRALYHGLTAVASESAGAAPRFPVRPLPDAQEVEIATLKEWLRQFVAVRDEEGAERCVVTAVRAGASEREMADMLFAAVTDFRYVDTGHPADFTNKAFEALEWAGWEHAEVVLSALVRGYARASRAEEANAWRRPVDLIAILDKAFARLPQLTLNFEADGEGWSGREALASVLLDGEPQAIADALLEELESGAPAFGVASAVSHAAALRIARFHTSNEFGDWDTALHTFTFANAIEQGLRRAPSCELLRGVFDAAMSVFLDRFLNIPPARLPARNGNGGQPADLLKQFPALLDRQQQVEEAGVLVARYLYGGGDPDALLSLLGHLLLREDRDFHTIQTLEAAFRQFRKLDMTPAGVNSLVGAARYLAAHAPTVRAQEQTFNIATRLHKGEQLFVE